MTPMVVMTQDLIRSTYTTLEKDQLKSGISGKTNYARP